MLGWLHTSGCVIRWEVRDREWEGEEMRDKREGEPDEEEEEELLAELPAVRGAEGETVLSFSSWPL